MILVKKGRYFFPLFALMLCLGMAEPAFACTTTLVGKDASADGSVMVSHSDDAFCDPRLVYVPAMDHAPDSLRPVFYSDSALGYKPEWGSSAIYRIVTKDRGPIYDMSDVPASIPLGYIPQVAHTYAYYDGNYGVMNEYQLSIGECTDIAKVEPEPESNKRIFYSAELSRVALERCKTAREAITLMGNLIEEYGYYGTGETLLVADKNEGWVMEMAADDINGASGVWVAQRVPDDKVFVAANQFRIREVLTDTDGMMYSQNIFTVAQEKGWWTPESGPLDFTSVYGGGEYGPYNSLRRIWRVQSLVAPSLKLSPWVEGWMTRAYPFAVAPDKKLSVRDIVAIHRDNYEGTEFDLTTGLAAGPFGDPSRFDGKNGKIIDKDGKVTTVSGSFERPINKFRCVYAFVTQSRSWMPDAVGGVLWLGPNRPATTVYMPFYAGAGNLPESVQQGNILKFDRSSMWMAFNYVDNYSMLKYSYMSKDIFALRDTFEKQAFEKQPELEKKALELWTQGDQQRACAILTSYSEKNADTILASWWKLSEDLYIKYNDGFLNNEDGIGQQLFYPGEWLQQVGYEDGPTSYDKKTPEKK